MSVPPSPYDPASQGTPPPPPGPGAPGSSPAFPGYGPGPGYTSSAPGYGPTQSYPPQPGPSPIPVPPLPGGGQPSYAAPGDYPPTDQQPYGAQPSYAPAGYGQGGYGQGGYGQPPSKSRVPLIVGLVAALVVVVGGVTAAVLVAGHGGGVVVVTTTGTATPTVTTPVSGPTDTQTDTPSPDSTDIIPPGYTLSQSLPSGTCFSRISSSFELKDTSSVDCGTPHAMEIVGTFTVSAPYTDQNDPRIGDEIHNCQTNVLAGLISSDDQRLQNTGMNVWYPSAAQISGGSTKGYCMFMAGDPTTDDHALMTGSVFARTFQGVTSS